jgi:hypothetical protein
MRGGGRFWEDHIAESGNSRNHQDLERRIREPRQKFSEHWFVSV